VPTDYERILVLAPTSADAALSQSILTEARLASHLCADVDVLVSEWDAGAGALLLTEEVLQGGDVRHLADVIRTQPPWSDIPILLLSATRTTAAATAEAVELLGNVTILDRPVRLTTLISALKAALRSRRRQYQLRDQLETYQRADQTRALLAAIVESSDDAIVGKTLEGVIQSWNAGAHRIFGYTPEETIGRPITLIIPPDKQDEETSILRRLRQGQRIDHFETVRVTKDGRLVNLSLSISPVRDSSGQIVGVSKVARDITARKRTEETVRKQGERLQLLWEAAEVLLTTDEPDLMMQALFAKIAPHFALDTYFNFMVNESGEGLNLVSYVGTPDAEARKIARIDFGQGICGNAALLRESIVANDIQHSADPHVQLVKSWGLRTFACNPLLAGNRLLGTLSFASRRRDRFDDDELEFLRTICHYVTVAYERVRLIQQLRDTDRRKDEFLATLAHELRNPLAPIRNSLHIMRLMSGDAASVTQARNMMERQLVQMVRLIDDLLDVSRVTRGKLDLRKERVDLASVISSAVETARPLIEAAGHELTIQLSEQPIFLDADPMRLAQVFANLLNNSAKYMDRGGRIWLTAERAQGHGERPEAVVAVRDSGVGIPPEALPRIFDMFAQVDQSLEKSQGGLGIGLTLVKRLVEMHGGTVEAHSEGAGKGSLFTARLPVVGARPVVQPAAGENGVTRHRMCCRMLVADDNQDAAESMGMMLRLMGHEVRTVHDGIQAVDESAAFRPDIVLLDIGMPRLNGYDAARRIRAQDWGQRMILIALTGWGQEEDKRLAADAGFNQHFTKPVNPADIEKLVARLRGDDASLAEPIL
jgi:PAS domain S-box-containing protein